LVHLLRDFDSISREVKTYKPWTIVAAFSFARVQEEKISDEARKPTTASSIPVTSGNGSSSTPTRKTTHLTQEELKEKTAMGLCWHNDEKWHRGNVCKQGKLLMIEPMALEINSDESEQEGNTLDNNEDEVTYTVRALVGYSNPQTMKVRGLLKR
jgi:hypothetical protein